jgi:hypothetical protein
MNKSRLWSRYGTIINKFLHSIPSVLSANSGAGICYFAFVSKGLASWSAQDRAFLPILGHALRDNRASERRRAEVEGLTKACPEPVEGSHLKHILAAPKLTKLYAYAAPFC